MQRIEAFKRRNKVNCSSGQKHFGLQSDWSNMDANDQYVGFMCHRCIFDHLYEQYSKRLLSNTDLFIISRENRFYVRMAYTLIKTINSNANRHLIERIHIQCELGIHIYYIGNHTHGKWARSCLNNILNIIRIFPKNKYLKHSDHFVH